VSQASPVAHETLRQLNPQAIESLEQMLSVFQWVQRERVELRRGMNREVEPERAYLDQVTPDLLVFRLEGFDDVAHKDIFLNFVLGDRRFFFAAPQARIRDDGRLETAFPRAIHVAERRDRLRRTVAPGKPGWKVLLLSETGRSYSAEVRDRSAGGVGLQTTGPVELRAGERVVLRAAESPAALTPRQGELRYVSSNNAPARVGVSFRPPRQSQPSVIHLSHLVDPDAAPLVAAPEAAEDLTPRIIRYKNELGEEIVAIVDSTGDVQGAPAVVIPPAWGRTKETLLPLARSLVAVFSAAGLPLVVVRFDGIRKRGESYNDPECRAPGTEHHHFSVSQGVRDILATLEFLEQAPEFRTQRSVLVTFSASAIEGRRAVWEDAGRRLAGWVSVVGPADLQSAMRVIAGGVDFMAGGERGVAFGRQEVLGIEVDVDRSNRDALEHELGFLEDAQRDFSEIRVPITWFHGAFDAWMDLRRVTDALSCGETESRRIYVMPTGHQLRSSRQAAEAFQAISSEAGRMLYGYPLAPCFPHPQSFAKRRQAERARMPARRIERRRFWRNYVVGREGLLGMELMAAGPTFRRMMADQIRMLALRGGERVLDVGSGTGVFEAQLREVLPDQDTHVVALDFIPEGLKLARGRSRPNDARAQVGFVAADLDAGPIPAKEGAFDAVIASLLLSYLRDPELALSEMRRVLRPGGRLVISSLTRDADFSRSWVHDEAALRSGLAADRLGQEAAAKLDDSLRSFFNDAARVLDLEEAGVFRFWEPDELAALMASAGFYAIEQRRALGNPPQASIVAGRR